MIAEARIRRLRWRLTALFSLTSAVGLIVLAAFAIHSDDVSWRNEVDDFLRLQASDAIPYLDYDQQGRLDATELAGGVDSSCPALIAMSATGGRLTVEHQPRDPCVRVHEDDLHWIASDATASFEPVITDVRSVDGRPVRLLAEPLTGPDGDHVAGSVLVAALDTSSYLDEHRRTVLLLVAGCAVLVALSAVSGYLLSGRATRPALTALRQQEEFLADAAHDLRSPAASLRAMAETSLHDEAARHRTVRLAARMGDLIDGLLTRARLMAGVGAVDRQRLRLDQLVEAVVDDTDTGEHQVTTDTRPVIALADPDLLRRAVTNLLNNALAHGHAPDSPAQVEISVREGTVIVDDAGPGIPPELADSLFERFHSGGGSTGLGLSIASWVTHAHGGTLTAESSPRGGARFVLRLR